MFIKVYRNIVRGCECKLAFIVVLHSDGSRIGNFSGGSAMAFLGRRLRHKKQFI